MKKHYHSLIIILMVITVTAFISGCGDSGNKNDMKDTIGEKLEEAATSSFNDSGKESDEDDENKDRDEEKDKADSDKAEPASLYFLTKDMYIEDKMDKYAVNMQDQGYTGDIGDIIPEYKGVDLDGDTKADIIERYGDGNDGYGYKIEFSDNGSIDTGIFSSSPNEGEVIEFLDLDNDYTDEILITHYTLSTAGPMCWQTCLYAKSDNGKWQGFPIIDEDNKLYCSDLKDMIQERNGVSYDDQNIRFADVEMTDDGVAMLADFGLKDGPEQTLDYEGVLLLPELEKIKAGKASDSDAFEYDGSSKDMAAKYWPLDTAEDTGAEDMSELQGEYSGSDDPAEETIPEYLLYVNSPDGYANLRTGPGAEYDIICQIPNGGELEVYRTDATSKTGKKWLKVAYFEGSGDDYTWTTGWIAESQVE